MQKVVSQAVLFEANQKKTNIELQTLFESWIGINTVQNYTQVWRQLLCYIFCTEDEDIEKQPVYKITGRQKIAITEVQSSI